MYEISLVPDVKGELLKKQKLRNLIILVCIAVAVGCVVLLLVMFGISSGQQIKIGNIKNEIKCRYDGSGNDCGKYDTAILNVQNSEDFLTIQKQMENVGSLNDEKVKLSRIFGVLDVILPDDGHDRVTLTELSVDLLGWSIYFDATANSDNGIHFRAVENFQKGIALSYYDYGSYMRKATDADRDNEEVEIDSDGYTQIPSYCIDEISVKGYVFGVYHKGMPYCEENIIVDNNKIEEEEQKEKENKDEDEEKEEAVEEYVDKVDKARAELKPFQRIYESGNVYYLVEDIYIRRTYRNVEDMEKYREGKDPDVQEKIKNISSTPTGYYFSSNCLQYDSKGNLDEAATRQICPVLSGDLMIGSQGAGRDSDGNLMMSFEASVPLSREIFLAQNTHMQIKNSTRQNVTDSYIQVRDMFSEELTPEGEVR